MSLDKFARKLGLTPGAIFYWEKALKSRLLPINEAAVRSLSAEELGVEISGKFSQLVGGEVKEIVIEIPKPTRRRRSED